MRKERRPKEIAIFKMGFSEGRRKSGGLGRENFGERRFGGEERARSQFGSRHVGYSGKLGDVSGGFGRDDDGGGIRMGRTRIIAGRFREWVDEPCKNGERRGKGVESV